MRFVFNEFGEVFDSVICGWMCAKQREGSIHGHAGFFVLFLDFLEETYHSTGIDVGAFEVFEAHCVHFRFVVSRKL